MEPCKVYFAKIFQSAAEVCGKEALADPARLPHLFAALAPTATAHRLLLEAFIQVNGPQDLWKAVHVDSFHQHKTYLRIVAELCTTYFYKEAAAKGICSAFFEAIGGNGDELAESIRADADIDAIFAIFNR